MTTPDIVSTPATTTSTPVAESPAATAVGGSPAAQSGASSSSQTDWTAGFGDDLKGYVQNKGFKDPSALAESYRQYEKLLGVPQDQIVKKPKDFSDKAAVNEYYAKLGRPEKPDGYGFAAPEGGNPELAEWAKNQFHELGLTSQQGKELFAKWNEKIGAATTAQLEASKVALQAQEATLKKTWGAGYDQNVQVAKQGANKFGLDEATLDGIESVLGYQKTMELFHKIGSATGEHAFVGANAGSGSPGQMSPEAARQKITGLMRDKDFVQKLENKSSQEVTEWNSLHKIAYRSE